MTRITCNLGSWPEGGGWKCGEPRPIGAAVVGEERTIYAARMNGVRPEIPITTLLVLVDGEREPRPVAVSRIVGRPSEDERTPDMEAARTRMAARHARRVQERTERAERLRAYLNQRAARSLTGPVDTVAEPVQTQAGE